MEEKMTEERIKDIIKKNEGNKEEFLEGAVYLGAKNEDGSWRLRVESGELIIEKREDNDWEIKQSMS